MGKISALANLVVGVSPLLVALPVVAFSSLDNLLPGAGIDLAVATMLAGFVAFALAKVTRFRSGHWLSFGFRGMPAWGRRCYVVGLVALGSGAIGSLSLALLLPSLR
jgi:hypothetical protein